MMSGFCRSTLSIATRILLMAVLLTGSSVLFFGGRTTSAYLGGALTVIPLVEHIVIKPLKILRNSGSAGPLNSSKLPSWITKTTQFSKDAPRVNRTFLMFQLPLSALKSLPLTFLRYLGSGGTRTRPGTVAIFLPIPIPKALSAGVPSANPSCRRPRDSMTLAFTLGGFDEYLVMKATCSSRGFPRKCWSGSIVQSSAGSKVVDFPPTSTSGRSGCFNWILYSGNG